ncbi:MAG: preprotein translocase subunit YajC [Microscillaceae bacterium]
MTLLHLFLQAAGGGLPFWITLVGVILVTYFFMILPEQRRKKQQAQFRQNLKVGDEIVTLGGLHGKIYALKEDTIVISVDKGTKLVIEKNAVLMEPTLRLKKESSDKNSVQES